MVLADSLIANARRYIGVRFVHQGRSEEGLDCLGLLLRAAEDTGIAVRGVEVRELDIPNYGARPDIMLLQQKLAASLAEITCSAVQPGDVLLLKIAGSPQHLALVSDYPMDGELGMIHAYAPARQVVEHRYSDDWKRATYKAYRLD